MVTLKRTSPHSTLRGQLLHRGSGLPNQIFLSHPGHLADDPGTNNSTYNTISAICILKPAVSLTRTAAAWLAVVVDFVGVGLTSAVTVLLEFAADLAAAEFQPLNLFPK